MLRIRKYQPSDARNAAALIYRTFAKFNRTEGNKEAIQGYLAQYNPKQNPKDIVARFSRTQIFYVAADRKMVVGLIRGRENRVINLFIDSQRHRHGIGSALMTKFENQRRRAGVKEIVLRSSLYAVPFYLTMGYKKTTGIRTFHGLMVQPMKKRL